MECSSRQLVPIEPILRRFNWFQNRSGKSKPDLSGNIVTNTLKFLMYMKRKFKYNIKFFRFMRGNMNQNYR